MTAPPLPRTVNAALQAALEAARLSGVDPQAAAHIAASALRAVGHDVWAALVEESAGIDVDPWTWPPARPATPCAGTAQARRVAIADACRTLPRTAAGDRRVCDVAADAAAGRLDGLLAADLHDGGGSG